MAENLTSRIRAAEAHGEQYFQSSSLKQKKKDIEQFMPHFNEALQCFSNTLRLKNSLSGINRNISLGDLELSENLRAVHADLDKGTFNPWNAEKLKNAIKNAEQRCIEVWKQYVQNRTGGSKIVLQSIKNVVSEETEYKELRKAEIRINTSVPCSTEALSAIDSYLEHFSKLIEQIHLDDDVLMFLKEMTESGSVPLKSLTSDTLKKLQNEKFSNMLHISIR